MTTAASTPPPSLDDLMFPGQTARWLGHLETWNRTTAPHPYDRNRWNGFDQLNPADVDLDVENLHRLGGKAGMDIMDNGYAPGTTNSQSWLLYAPRLAAAGMKVMPGMDKGVYQNAPDKLGAQKGFVQWTRTNIWSLGNGCRHTDGRLIMPVFVRNEDTPEMFRALERDPAHKDILFCYNDLRVADPKALAGYSWINEDPLNHFEAWLKKYATPPAGATVLIPHIFAGLDTTYLGHDVWNKDQGPRIYGPPSVDVLRAAAALVAKYYSATNQPPWVGLATLNDVDEGSDLAPHKDGTLRYLSFPKPAPPAKVAPTVDHRELWNNGVKLGNFTPAQLPAGAANFTVVTVMSDKSLKKDSGSITIES